MEDAQPRPIVLVKVGETFDALRERRGDFEHWMADGLGPTRQPLVVLDPRRGDTLPDPGTIAGAVVSGSHAMVSHREAWSEATGAWLARLVAEGTPVLGICFGHQLLADALGGEADDHPLGMEVGTVEVELAPAAADDPLLKGLPARFAAHVVHSQSALRLPPGAVRLAGNAFEPTQAFRLGAAAWGVQFHPEFDAEIMRGYVDQMARPLARKGTDPVALRERVAPTPEAAAVLPRFARIVEAHEDDTAAARAGCQTPQPAAASCANVWPLSNAAPAMPPPAPLNPSAPARRHFSMIRGFHLADVFTLGNAACGVGGVFLAMAYVASRSLPDFLWAAALAPAAFVFDVFDGRIARWRQTHSALGRELDSLADVISFGVAPAALAFAAGLNGGWDCVLLIYFVCCGVSRLARYNVTAEALSEGADKVKYFEGTPIPTSVALVAVLAVAAWQGHIGDSIWGGAWLLGPWVLHPLTLLFGLSGTLMISKTLRIPKF